MKIVFHIPRMNWYRVLSSVIDEALSRGHNVECWHYIGAKALKENCPNRKKVPTFRSGTPVIIDYERPEEIIRLIERRLPEVIVDIHPPRYREINEIKKKRGGSPFWLLVDLPPSDGFIEIQNDNELYGCDAFAICNHEYLEASIRYGKQDKIKLAQNVYEKAPQIGAGPGKWISDRFMYQFKDKQEQYIREQSHIVGNAGFDGYLQIDREAVKRRYKINEKYVIVILPFPFGYDQTAAWEQIFIRKSFFSRLHWAITQNRLGSFWKSLSLPSNAQVIKSLRRFADNNNALLIGKIRHSRSACRELKRYCHLLVGEEGYYPHTAAELFSVANLVVGYYSTASTEAVALGVPYLNIDVHGFPKKFYCDTRKPLFSCDPFPGVIWNLKASEVITELPLKSLGYFRIQPEMREKYLRKFANFPLGKASARIIKFLENTSKLKQ